MRRRGRGKSQDGPLSESKHVVTEAMDSEEKVTATRRLPMLHLFMFWVQFCMQRSISFLGYCVGRNSAETCFLSGKIEREIQIIWSSIHVHCSDDRGICFHSLLWACTSGGSYSVHSGNN